MLSKRKVSYSLDCAIIQAHHREGASYGAVWIRQDIYAVNYFCKFHAYDSSIVSTRASCPFFFCFTWYRYPQFSVRFVNTAYISDRREPMSVFLWSHFFPPIFALFQLHSIRILRELFLQLVSMNVFSFSHVYADSAPSDCSCSSEHSTSCTDECVCFFSLLSRICFRIDECAVNYEAQPINFLDDLSLNLWDCGGQASPFPCTTLDPNHWGEGILCILISIAGLLLGKLFPAQRGNFLQCRVHDIRLQCGEPRFRGTFTTVSASPLPPFFCFCSISFFFFVGSSSKNSYLFSYEFAERVRVLQAGGGRAEGAESLRKDICPRPQDGPRTSRAGQKSTTCNN